MARYEIILSAGGAAASKSPIAGGKGRPKKTTDPEQEALKARKAGVNAYVHIKRNIAPFVSMGLQYTIGTVTLRTGRVERQQRMQFAYGVVSQTGGILENIAIGALVGNLPGAIAGAVAGVAQTALSYGLQYSKIRTEENLENVSLALMNIRAGGSVASYSQSRGMR